MSYQKYIPILCDSWKAISTQAPDLVPLSQSVPSKQSTTGSVFALTTDILMCEVCFGRYSLLFPLVEQGGIS